jgi:hypothetical protein
MMANGIGNGNGGLTGVNPAPNDYLWDVFLSYSYKTDVQEWVKNKFSQRFRDDLESNLIQLNLFPPPARVYIARRELKVGDLWPNELQEALKRSKVLVAICSPHYFVSTWCRSEWATFQQRAPNLILPVLYYGTDNYLLPKINPIQAVDFRDFKQIPGGRVARFNQKIEEFATNVALKVSEAPVFNDFFPSVSLPPVPIQNGSFLSL